ncbi:MAG TPA: hypothetical protein VGE37_07110 [Archangium sp.]|jgi:hypothetical protein
MSIQGIEGLTVGDVQQQVQQGGRFVVFGYAMSFLVVTLRRSSEVVFIKPGESAVMKGLPYTLLSLFIGWWGFPWGLIYTPMVIIQNLSGGKDVTAEVMNALVGSVAQQGLPAVQVE